MEQAESKKCKEERHLWNWVSCQKESTIDLQNRMIKYKAVDKGQFTVPY